MSSELEELAREEDDAALYIKLPGLSSGRPLNKMTLVHAPYLPFSES